VSFGAEVAGGGEESRPGPKVLPRYADDPIPDLMRMRDDLGRVDAPTAVVAIARRAKADMVLIGAVAEPEGQREVRLFLYDVRCGKLVRTLRRALGVGDETAAAPALAAAILHQTPLDGVWRPAGGGGRRVRLKAWHWGLIGAGAAVLIGVAVGVAVGASQGSARDPRRGLLLRLEGAPGVRF
jgi:hypothetical protein